MRPSRPVRPFVLGATAVGAALLAAAGAVALNRSMDPPPPRTIGVAVVVTPLPVASGYQSMTGLCLAPQQYAEVLASCSAPQDP